MPRSLIRDWESIASSRIFGTGLTALNVAELSRRTSIHTSTLYGWRRHPQNMTLRGLAKIARATKMTDAQIAAAVREIR